MKRLKCIFCTLCVFLLSGKATASPTTITPALAHDASNYQAQVIDPDFSGALYSKALGLNLSWGSDAVIEYSQDGQHWHQAELVDRFFSDDLNQVVEAQTHTGTLLLALSKSGSILWSEDAKHWTPCPGLEGITDSIHAATYLSTNRKWLAVGDHGLMLESENPRKGWDISRNGLEAALLSLHTLTEGSLLIGSATGLIARSEDSGKSWRLTQAETDTPVLNFFQFDNLVIATSTLGRLIISKDSGSTWSLLQSDAQSSFRHATLIPKHNSIIISGEDNSLLVHTLGTDNWQHVRTTMNGRDTYIYNLYYDSPRERTLAFTHDGLVLQSMDGGFNWNGIASLPYASNLIMLVPEKPSSLYFFGARGYRSKFELRSNAMTELNPAMDFYWRSAMTTKANTLLLGAEVGKMLRSADAGETWRMVSIQYPHPLTPPTYRSMMPLADGRALAAGPTGMIMHSEDDGQTWQTSLETPFEQGDAITDMIASEDQQTLIAVEAFNGSFISRDGGRTWTRLEYQKTERNLWFGDFISANKAVLVGQQGLVMQVDITSEKPAVHTLDIASQADLFGLFTTADHVFLLGAKGELQSCNTALTQCNKIPLNTDADFRGMVRDTKRGNLILFGQQGSIFVSQDKGKNWTQRESGVDSELRNAIIEPGSGAVLITGRDGTLLRSVDGGLNWEQIATHTSRHFRSLTLEPHTGNLVLFGERIAVLTPSPQNK